MKKYFLLFSMVTILVNASENPNMPYKNKLKTKEEKILKEFRQKYLNAKRSKSRINKNQSLRVIKAKRKLF